MQSPTGDSSDHHNYIFPCKTMIQAQFIIDMHHNMAHNYIYAIETPNGPFSNYDKTVETPNGAFPNYVLDNVL